MSPLLAKKKKRYILKNARRSPEVLIFSLASGRSNLRRAPLERALPAFLRSIEGKTTFSGVRGSIGSENALALTALARLLPLWELLLPKINALASTDIK